jgi:hypothetical protein
MDAAALRAELEAEWTWRLDELRFLKNQLANIGNDEQSSIYRKSLVVMLYSHFEGFCKAAFAVYVHALNAEGLAVQQVNAALVASAFSRIFGDLRYAEKKSEFFRTSAPDDSGLHRYARDREFVERFDEFLKLHLTLDSDAIVDTESNLRPVVLQKIIFRLGMNHLMVDPWLDAISQLIGRRNAIAHGSSRKGIDAKEYIELELAVMSVIAEITKALFDAAVSGLHLKSSSAAA